MKQRRTTRSEIRDISKQRRLSDKLEYNNQRSNVLGQRGFDESSTTDILFGLEYHLLSMLNYHNPITHPPKNYSR